MNFGHLYESAELGWPETK